MPIEFRESPFVPLRTPPGSINVVYVVFYSCYLTPSTSPTFIAGLLAILSFPHEAELLAPLAEGVLFTSSEGAAKATVANLIASLYIAATQHHHLKRIFSPTAASLMDILHQSCVTSSTTAGHDFD